MRKGIVLTPCLYQDTKTHTSSHCTLPVGLHGRHHWDPLPRRADRLWRVHCPAGIMKPDLCPLGPPATTPTSTARPGAHLAEVVKVVLVPDPPVAGFGTVRLVGDVPGVLTLAHEELSFEELGTRVPGDREK